MAHDSASAIYTAAAANLAVAAVKLTAGGLTGSAAMLAEGAHSVVDTANQFFLFLGLKRSTRPPDERHPFGYGREIFFYGFVVAILMFSGGGVFAIYHGVEHVMQPVVEPDTTIAGLTLPGYAINLGVIGVATVLETYSCWVALRAFRTRHDNPSFYQALVSSKDPSIFVVLIEDLAALVGLLIAAAGIGLSTALGAPVLDGCASIAIGVMLLAVTVFLMRETHALLIGEAADPALMKCIEEALRGNPHVHRVHEILTQHLGPADILINVSVDFDDEVTAGEVERMIAELERRLRAAFPKVGRVFVKPQSSNTARSDD